MEYLGKKKVTSGSIDEKDMINKFSQKGLSGRFLSNKPHVIPDVSDTGREASPNEEMEESKRKLFQSWYNEKFSPKTVPGGRRKSRLPPGDTVRRHLY